MLRGEAIALGCQSRADKVDFHMNGTFFRVFNKRKRRRTPARHARDVNEFP